MDVLGVWELFAQPGSTEAGAVPAVSNCSSPGCLSGRVAHSSLRGETRFLPLEVCDISKGEHMSKLDT